MNKINLPLMANNIDRKDLDSLIDYLKTDEPRLTQGAQVEAFEKEWSEWVGTKYSVFLNSGSSANMLTISALKYLKGKGEVILPPLTWVSDVCSVLLQDMTPVFVDIDPKNLAMSHENILKAITPNTKAVFLTHILGFNGLSEELVQELDKRNIPLIEDVCESHGATCNGKKLGSFGWASNFSFYFAHHMSTIEGGMVCTNDEELYDTIRMLRSHGMVRELKSEERKQKFIDENPELNEKFIFAYPAFNMRSTELNAVIGRSQLKNLDDNNQKRVENCQLFYENLDPKKFRTDFDFSGSVNYAFVLILKEANETFRDNIEKAMDNANVEYRRGTSGGGNQLRQPYVRKEIGDQLWTDFPVVDHIHFFGYYIGNYPTLEKEKITNLCKLLNSVEIN